MECVDAAGQKDNSGLVRFESGLVRFGPAQHRGELARQRAATKWETKWADKVSGKRRVAYYPWTRQPVSASYLPM